MNKKLKFTLALGLLITAIAQMAWHFLPLPDFVNGLLMGLLDFSSLYWSPAKCTEGIL